MAQHDQVLANAAGATFRADANSALAALFSNSSGATEPSTMVAYQFWGDTTTGILKQRNAANTAWISLWTMATGVMLANAALAGSSGQAFSASTLSAATTIGVGAATPAASGAGITFPATQSASSDANTLDDYEEGTWTATLTGSTAAPTTPVTVTGTYIKIGKIVTVGAIFNNKDTTGATGDLRVTGLPFTASSNVYIGSAALAGIGTAVGYCYPTSTRIDINNSITTAGIPIVAGAGKYVHVACSFEI